MGIKLFDIQKNSFAREDVPAESLMRFLYGNPIGALSVWALFKRGFFSRLCGMWAASKRSAKAVAPFVAKNGINCDEMVFSPEKYETFNAFFTRRLVDGARPIEDAGNENAVSFPSDGRHLLVRNVSEADKFYAKGQRFDLRAFFGDAELARNFGGGDMLISRLAPVDYHRFHFPLSGCIAARRLINGALYSVSPIALVPRLSVLWENRRVMNIVENPKFGFYAFFEIGATNVGSIVNTRNVGDCVARGDEAGYFNFGGSCVISIFPKGVKWNEKLVQMSAEGVECYAKEGMKAGEFVGV